ncbi:MAG: 16S rRNA (adenine(1518)-N(6)/adenine(1519)-N(6))-dimethyltransferase RsmA, partial [Clostridiales bacterium]|nr:16S rRNA (adenine(1518)-N(6)/adenine(1519)-N(6))-dimethyltransferase RsmA [Clostridiales bacterium]
LVDEGVLDKITAECGVGAEDFVIEIGPGAGALTNRLAQAARRVAAIELDERFVRILRKNTWENVEIIHGDIMKFDLEGLVARQLNECPQTSRAFIIANLPYYITTPIIARVLESELPIYSMTVMVQREVAHRIAATGGNKDYGAFSVLCQYYSRPKIICEAAAACFFPKPKVDSSVVRMDILDSPSVDAPRDAFFCLVRAGFAQRRKTFVNSASNVLKIKKDIICQALIDIGKSENIRAEQLSPGDFSKLAKLIDLKKA